MKYGLIGFGAAFALSAVVSSAASAAIISVSDCTDIRDPDASFTFTVPTAASLGVAPSAISTIDINFSQLQIAGEIYTVKKSSTRAGTTFDASLGIYKLKVTTESGFVLGFIDFKGKGNPDDVSVENYTVAANTPAGEIIKQGTWEGSNVLSFNWATYAAALTPGTPVTLYLEVDQMNYNGSGSSLIDWRAALNGSVEVTYTTVPELASFGMLGLGAAGLMLLRRK